MRKKISQAKPFANPLKNVIFLAEMKHQLELLPGNDLRVLWVWRSTGITLPDSRQIRTQVQQDWTASELSFFRR